MKTTMTISLEKDLKQEFTEFSKALGTNPTNLLSMMIKSTLNSGEVKFSVSPFLDVEVESFSKKETKALKNNKNIQKNIKKLEKVFN